MGYKLLIVESPNKASTIQKYLDASKDKWIVLSTKGHILNLPEHELGLEFQGSKVQGKWVVERGKKKIIDEISKYASKAQEVFIATDDDREGEKIAFDAIQKAGISRYKRVVFHEITKKEVLEKLARGAREIDSRVVEAAKVRRFIDREVGYPISQIIKREFRKLGYPYVPRGVGRVISPALHILVEREHLIQSFVPEKYYRIAIDYIKDGLHFRCTNQIQFKKDRERELNEMIAHLNTNPHIVYDYKRKTEDVPPKKPLVTSSLQYGGWYLYGFKPSKTMSLAQELFEWGYITYHRTDSYRISDEAYESMVGYLLEYYGDEYVMKEKRRYKLKESAHDAHEAIRPTMFEEGYEPEALQKQDNRISEDHKRLYALVWYRTLATQMKDAVYDVSELTVDIGGNYFFAKAHKQLFDGWERLRGHIVRLSDVNEEDERWKEREVILPEFTIGDELMPLDIIKTEHMTQRPKRYGIGRFITTLDNKGIARPSTLDTIVENLEKKGYVQIRKGMLYPTELGMEVDRWTCKHCNWLCDVDHAKEFEEKLDAIERGEIKNGDEIVLEYKKLVDELGARFGYDVHSNEPSEAQKELIRKIAQEKGIEIGEELLRNKKLAEAFIKSHLKSNELGRCPGCSNGSIREGKGFYCSNTSCDFFISQSRFEKLCELLGLEPGSDEAIRLKEGVFKKSGKVVEFIKDNRRRRARVHVVKDRQFGWSFKLDWIKERFQQHR